MYTTSPYAATRIVSFEVVAQAHIRSETPTLDQNIAADGH